MQIKSKKVKNTERLNELSKQRKVDNLSAMQNYDKDYSLKLFKAFIKIYKKED